MTEKQKLLLQLFREYRERLVLQTAQHLAVLSFVRQGFSSGDEIGLDVIVIAP